MVKDLFCADRGISQAKPHNPQLQLQLLKLGLSPVKHYNDDMVDRQGKSRGIELVGRDFHCPMMPTPLDTAGTTYINSRTDEDRAHRLNLIQSRKDSQAKIKEYGPAGDQRRQCPALGPHSTVTYYRRSQAQAGRQHLPGRLHREEHHCPRRRVGQVAAEIHPVHPLWQEAWSGLRSQNECGIDNPQFRLIHGRVTQTLRNAVIILVANLRSIERFRLDQGIQPRRVGTPRTAPPKRPARRPRPGRNRFRPGRPSLFPQMKGAAPGPPPHQPLTEPITRPEGPRNDEKPASHVTQPVIRERIEADLVNVPTMVSEGGLEPPRPIKGTSTSS